MVSLEESIGAAGAAARPLVAILLAPAMREKLIPPAAEARLAEVAEIRAPDHGELTPENLPRLLQGARACVTGWGTPPLEEALLARCPDLGLVAHSAGSIRRLLPFTAIERGLQVTHAATHIAEAVAEYVLAQILFHLRQPHALDQGMRAKVPWFELRDRHLGRLLGAQTVGIVGAGYVGRLVIQMLRAFGARVLVFDPLLSEERARELGVERRDLDAVLGADIVSLHAPVLDETRGMIGAPQLARMRDGALFINTARAALVDEQALLAELRTGRIRAVLDVFSEEPLPDDSPFRALPNAVVSPHSAGHTADTYLRQGASTIDDVCRFLRGEPLQHAVTPKMLASMA